MRRQDLRFHPHSALSCQTGADDIVHVLVLALADADAHADNVAAAGNRCMPFLIECFMIDAQGLIFEFYVSFPKCSNDTKYQCNRNARGW